MNKAAGLNDELEVRPHGEPWLDLVTIIDLEWIFSSRHGDARVGEQNRLRGAAIIAGTPESDRDNVVRTRVEGSGIGQAAGDLIVQDRRRPVGLDVIEKDAEALDALPSSIRIINGAPGNLLKRLDIEPVAIRPVKRRKPSQGKWTAVNADQDVIAAGRLVPYAGLIMALQSLRTEPRRPTDLGVPHRAGSAPEPSGREGQIEVARIDFIDAGHEVELADVNASPSRPLGDRPIIPIVPDDIAAWRPAEGQVHKIAGEIVEIALRQPPELNRQQVIKQLLSVPEFREPRDIAAAEDFFRLLKQSAHRRRAFANRDRGLDRSADEAEKLTCVDGRAEVELSRFRPFFRGTPIDIPGEFTFETARDVDALVAQLGPQAAPIAGQRRLRGRLRLHGRRGRRGWRVRRGLGVDRNRQAAEYDGRQGESGGSGQQTLVRTRRLVQETLGIVSRENILLAGPDAPGHLPPLRFAHFRALLVFVLAINDSLVASPACGVISRRSVSCTSAASKEAA